MSSTTPVQIDNDSSCCVPAADRAQNQSSVILFDWDDTLCPSSYLFHAGFRLETELTDEMRAELAELEVGVIRFLELAHTYGDVHIVTNAQTGWVELSAKKFLPGVVPLLAKTKVVSARSTFEGMFPNCPLKWKYYAFRENLSSSFAYTKLQRNVLSFGDSHYEREAVHAVTQGLPNTFTKSVKFTERPSLDQLRRQIDLVTSCFDSIHTHDGNLDLQLTITFPQDGSTPETPVEDVPSSATGEAAAAMSVGTSLVPPVAAASPKAMSPASKIAQQQVQRTAVVRA